MHLKTHRDPEETGKNASFYKQSDAWKTKTDVSGNADVIEDKNN